MASIVHYISTHRSVAAGLVLILIAATGTSVSYLSQATSLSADQPRDAPQIPSVEVMTVQPQSIRFWNEFSGRLRAIDYVEVRPRVGGTITHVLFEEGAIVSKDDPLFVIDPRPFQAEFASARAAMETAQSETVLAKQELKRAEGLVKKNAISQSRYDAAKNDYQVAMASINAAKARMRRAYLDLEYAHIKAPVSGRISRAEITAGNVIDAGSTAPVLATIVSIDRLYAEFDVDEQTYINTRRQASKETMPVELTLPSDTSVVYQGFLHSFDNQLNSASGTIRVRAIFPNKDGALVPGMFATVRLGSPSKQSALLVSDRAVRTDQDKKYVYVVTPEGKVAYREVQLGQAFNGQRVVLSGLEPGEQVLVNSLQRVRPDMEVQPVEAAKTRS